MNAKKNSLGRGLGALIEEASTINKDVIQAVEALNEIELSKIEVNPFQPRKHFDEDALEELSISIKQLGVIQPITVRKVDEGRYQLIAGERRFRAAQLAGLDRIPAFIRDADDQGMLEMALVENIHRADLNSIEVAISYQRLIEECSLTQEALSDRVGKKRSTITNYLRLLKLPAEVQLGIRNEKLSMGHARAIIGIEDHNKQLEIYNKIIADELSVREVEELVRNFNSNPEQITSTDKKQGVDNLDKEYDDLRIHLSKHFNANVEFKRNSKGAGKIVIPFKSDDDLEKIVAILDSNK
jgi:ParB family chromosome partitioning protein